MNQKPHLQNASVVGVFFLMICFRIFYAEQNVMLKFISDIAIVLTLLAFSEIILGTLIHWPIYIVLKTADLIRSKV